MSEFNPYLFFGVLIAGLVWIYFQIPRVKKETKPVVKSTKKDWGDSYATNKKYTYRIFFVGLICAITLILLFPYKSIWIIGITIELLGFAVIISIFSASIMIIFNQILKKNYLNN